MHLTGTMGEHVRTYYADSTHVHTQLNHKNHSNCPCTYVTNLDPNAYKIYHDT